MDKVDYESDNTGTTLTMTKIKRPMSVLQVRVLETV